MSFRSLIVVNVCSHHLKLARDSKLLTPPQIIVEREQGCIKSAKKWRLQQETPMMRSTHDIGMLLLAKSHTDMIEEPSRNHISWPDTHTHGHHCKIWSNTKLIRYHKNLFKNCTGAQNLLQHQEIKRNMSKHHRNVWCSIRTKHITTWHQWKRTSLQIWCSIKGITHNKESWKNAKIVAKSGATSKITHHNKLFQKTNMIPQSTH